MKLPATHPEFPGVFGIFQSERKQSENKKSSKLISLPRDEISRRCERKMEVVNLKRRQNQAHYFEIGRKLVAI